MLGVGDAQGSIYVYVNVQNQRAWTMHMMHASMHTVLQCVAVCCSVLQCVAVCCSVLQCVAVDIMLIALVHVRTRIRIVVCCKCVVCDARVCTHCVAVCCSVVQCVAVCCSVL